VVLEKNEKDQSWTDCVRNEKYYIESGERGGDILRTVKKGTVISIPLSGGIVLEESVDLSSDRLLMMMNWIGHILCRNCILKHIIEGKIGEI
jgi:hypothetical protein